MLADFSDLEAKDPVFGKGKTSSEPVKVRGGLQESTAMTPGVVGRFVDTCKRCKGSGQFITYTGRVGGKCNPCKGTGKVHFATSAETRAKSRASTAARVEKNWSAFKAADPSAAVWIEQRMEKFDFAKRMFDAARKHGKLTEGQRAGVQKCLDKDVAFAKARAEKAAAAPAVDVSKIAQAFERARGNDIKSPRMRVAEFTFKAAPLQGKNPGAIYITEGDLYLGKVVAGKLSTASVCSKDQEARIVEVCASPLESAIAHGRKTGVCSCCGRELSDPVSVSEGIGPICKERYFG